MKHSLYQIKLPEMIYQILLDFRKKVLFYSRYIVFNNLFGFVFNPFPNIVSFSKR